MAITPKMTISAQLQGLKITGVSPEDILIKGPLSAFSLEDNTYPISQWEKKENSLKYICPFSRQNYAQIYDVVSQHFKGLPEKYIFYRALIISPVEISIFKLDEDEYILSAFNHYIKTPEIFHGNVFSKKELLDLFSKENLYDEKVPIVDHYFITDSPENLLDSLESLIDKRIKKGKKWLVNFIEFPYTEDLKELKKNIIKRFKKGYLV